VLPKIWPWLLAEYAEIETSVLIAGIVEGHFEVVQVSIDELIIVDFLLVAVFFLPFFLLHLSYISATMLFKHIHNQGWADALEICI
jgi:hypothetical protein